MSVGPYPWAWPARYIHHCSFRFTTLASTSSAPPKRVEGSRGSKIFISVIDIVVRPVSISSCADVLTCGRRIVLAPAAKVLYLAFLNSVMLPGNSPVLIRPSRLHDELFAGKLVYARQIFAYKGPRERALNVEREGVRAFVDLVCAKGGLVPPLRILVRPGWSPCLRFAFHNLNRHVAVARVDKHPGTVNPVRFPVCTLLFEPGQPPRADKPVPDALIDTAILVAGQRHCDHTDKQRHYAKREQVFHVRLLVTRVSNLHVLQTYRGHSQPSVPQAGNASQTVHKLLDGLHADRSA